MNKIRLCIYFLLPAIIYSSCSEVAADNTNGETAPPNVIVILCDDLGYGDLSCQGSPNIVTPNIDALASQGARLTSFYSAGPVCTPSRKGMLTGRFAARIKADGNDNQAGRTGGMSQNEITLGDLFKNAGYATACIGKWDVGMAQGSHPNDQGFDYYYGTRSSNDHFIQNGFEYNYDWFKKAVDSNFNLPLYRQRDTIEIPARQSLFTKRYTDEAIKWITDHKSKPFFLYLAHNMPHVPVFASEGFAGKSKGGRYGDVVEELDWSVGEIMKTIQSQGLDNTLVIFTSDNGAWRIYYELGGSEGPFRNGKGTPWEGGHRVPAIFWWPNNIKPVVTSSMASNIDLFSTFTALLGRSPDSARKYDSYNLLPMLTEGKESPRTSFYYFSEVHNDLWAVRRDNYKLIVTTVDYHRAPPVQQNPPLLYNLEDDPSETHDVAAEHPEIVQQLLDIFNKMNNDLKK